MKKFLCTVIIALMATSIFAIDLTILPEQNRLEYLKSSLSINVDSITQSSAVGSSYYGVAFASGSSKNKAVWTPFYGDQEISKADFFRIVGENKLAMDQERIDKSNKTNRLLKNTFYGIGYGLAGIGLIIEFMPIIKDDYSDSGELMLYTGAGIALGGLAIAAIGIPFESKSKQELNVSTNFVIGLSENYNLKLYASLSK